jgi:hypothetical protein
LTFLVRPFRTKPSRAEWLTFLQALCQIQEREQYDLIIFDTISNLWPVRDENNAVDVQEALMPLHTAIGRAALALVHHLRKSDGGEGTGSRGSGALLGWVDIIVEMRRYDPETPKCTRRVLTGYGRYEQTPASLVIELQPDGQYRVEGDRAEVRTCDLQNTLRAFLPDEPPGWTVEEVTKNWPGDTAPRRCHLLAALKTGCREDLFLSQGKGVKGDPIRYSVPGQEGSAGTESQSTTKEGENPPPNETSATAQNPPPNNSYSVPALGARPSNR